MIKLNKSFFKTLVLICTLAIGIAVLAGCSANADSASGAPTLTPAPNTSAIYENPGYSIKISNPQRWVIKENTNGTAAMFLIPKEDSKDTFQQNVNIVVQDLSSQPMNLEKYTQISLDNAKKSIEGFNLISSENTTLSGSPAQKLVFTAKQEKNSLKLIQIWTIKNMSAYIITYVAEEDKYPSYLKIAQDMINSLEIGNASAN